MSATGGKWTSADATYPCAFTNQETEYGLVRASFVRGYNLSVKAAGIATVLLLTACARQSGGEQALQEAEAACGLPTGKLTYLGASDDPRRKDASSVRPLIVITGATTPRDGPTYQCIERFTSSRGYRIQQLITD
jgi:hypothetical protein